MVGLGNIGRIVADRARGLGMKVIGHDPFLTEQAALKLGIERVSFEDLLARSDVITLHVPRTKDTLGMLGREAFARIKPDVLVVNAARGGIVIEDGTPEQLESSLSELGIACEVVKLLPGESY